MQKKLGALLALLLCVFCSTALAAEREPLRVARVPLQIGTYLMPSDEVVHGMEKKIDMALHVPLNETMHYVTFLPEEDTRAAQKELRGQNYREMAKGIAQRLDADIVVIPLLTGYETYSHLGWRFTRGRIIHSYAAVRVVVYDRKEDRVIDKRAADRYDDEDSVRGEVGRMAIACMDTALRRADLHALLWARKG